MKFCDEIIQKHLLNGGKIKKSVKTDWFDDSWIFEKEYPTWQEAVNSKEFNE